MEIVGFKVIVTCPKQNYVLVKILTNDPDIYGVGDASLNGRELTVANLLEEYIGPMLIGRDPDQIEDFWHLVYQGSYWRGGNIMMSALCGVDMALWDIKAKRAKLPLYSLFGGKVRNKVLCYSHVAGANTEDRIENALDLVKRKGFKAIRLRVGVPAAQGTMNNHEHQMHPLTEVWDPRTEILRTVQNFKEIREAVGNDAEIIYDLHERFSPEQAIRVMRKLEDLNPFFIEDPISPENTESLKSIRKNTCVPIGFGELYKSRWECLEGMSERLFDYLRCDVIRIGGITEARKISALAETYNIKTAWHGPNDVSPITHAVNWHLNVATYNFGIQEYGKINSAVSEVISGGPYYKDGYLFMDDMIGIGCDINEEQAKKYPYKRAFIPICRKEDDSLTEW